MNQRLDRQMSSVGLVKVDDIAKAYDFGPSHPLRPERVLLTYDHIADLGLDTRPGVRSIPSRSATDEEILRVHDDDFVRAVRGIDAGEVAESGGFEFGLGTGDNPIFSGMHRASAAVCGASITAGEAVARGDVTRSFNPAGGLHHARRREASGFCIYNDPAAAIAAILELQPSWRVVYLDVDVHHGDGVQWIFYRDPRVMTVSLHQSGHYLYPGTGFEDEVGEGEGLGTSVNVPLLPLTNEEDYLWALEEVFPKVCSVFRPDVVVTQLGADTHHGDPLAGLDLTMTAYPRMARIIREAVEVHTAGRWVATGGGGYQAETVVPKVWTIHFAEMVGAPETIPPEWLEDRSPGEVSPSSRRAVQDSVSDVLERCLPRLEALATQR
ncbi:MAG: acetoin utilization protein AcuC [Actinomycetota bacterium]